MAYFAVATTWMVWNMLAGILLTGAQIITYDGSPAFGGPQKSFELVARNRATFFGAGAGVLSMVQRAGITPNVSMDFSALRSILVTGSPLPDAAWDWIYQAVSDSVRLGSDSGGTDVTSAFIGTNPYQPVYRGEIMGPYLGVDAQPWNSRGERVWDEVGELVITRPMPSMPVFFWDDPDGSRYRAAYFDMFPGVWRQGDWVTQLGAGPFVVHGRSDSTINRGGIRTGSADLTHVVDRVDGVAASMVIGAELAGGDYYMPLFVVPQPGTRLTEELRERIVDAIRTQVSPRYVPDEIIEAPAVPRTRTGKLLEIPVKKLFQGADPSSLNRATAEDAGVLDWYADIAKSHVGGDRTNDGTGRPQASRYPRGRILCGRWRTCGPRPASGGPGLWPRAAWQRVPRLPRRPWVVGGTGAERAVRPGTAVRRRDRPAAACPGGRPPGTRNGPRGVVVRRHGARRPCGTDRREGRGRQETILPGLKCRPGSATSNRPFMRRTPSGETSCSIHGWCSTPTPWWWESVAPESTKDCWMADLMTWYSSYGFSSSKTYANVKYRHAPEWYEWDMCDMIQPILPSCA